MASKSNTQRVASPPSAPELSPEQAGQQTKIEVPLRGVAETLLIPLASRAFDAATPKPILGDRYAASVLEKLNYDFSKVAMTPAQYSGVAIRTRQFDRWIQAFLTAHSRATVLHLACGLDNRAQRIEWSQDIRWVDVELPEVVAVRRQVLPESIPGRDYRLVGTDVLDIAWLEEVPADRPTIVVMEGLVSYLARPDVDALLSRLVERFPEGELLFECIGESALAMSSKLQAVQQTGAKFQWALQDPKSLEEISPRLEMMEAIRFVEAPGVEQLSLASRATMYMLSWMPSLRDSARFLRFRFHRTVTE